MLSITDFMDIEQIKLGKVHLGITFNATPHFIASAKVDMPPIPGFYIKDELTEKVYTGYLKGHDILSTLKCGVSWRVMFILSFDIISYNI